MNSLFNIVPFEIFTLILLWVIVKFLMLKFSFRDLWKTLAFGIFIGLFVLLPWKNEQNYSFEIHLSFLPFSLIIFITWIAVIFLWSNLRKPIHEGIISINIIALIYYLLEITKYKEYKWIFILIPFLIVYFIFSIRLHIYKLRISDTSQFGLILINTIILCILWGIYIKNILFSLYNWSLWVQSWYWISYFLFWMNLIYIFQQFALLNMCLPEEHTKYSTTFKKALEEYDLNYDWTIQTNSKYFILIIIIISVCTINYIYWLINPLYLVWFLFSFWILFEFEKIRNYLFISIK